MTQSASDAQQNEQIRDVTPESGAATQYNGNSTPKTNGEGGKGLEDDERPSKRRRVSDSIAEPVKPAKKKVESPPWKTAKAEGPSSFTQDGKRKSGRVNQLPLELQPPSAKRTTRGAIQKTYSNKNKNGNTKGTNSLGARDISSAKGNGSKKHHFAGSPQQPHSLPAKAPSSVKQPHKKSLPTEESSTPVRSHRKKVATSQESQSVPARVRASSSRRSGRVHDLNEDEVVTHSNTSKRVEGSISSPKTKLSFLKLKVRRAELPVTHPGLVIPQPRRYTTLKEFLDAGANIPVEQGGLFSTDESQDYTPEAIARDAQVLVRLEDAAAPGGLLSRENCSVYQPEEQSQPPQQFAHHDHFSRAAVVFRRLMVLEERKHRSNAKRLAEACRDEWYRRQPKSSEQLEADEMKANQGRYKNLVKALQMTWDNVRSEINRRRLLEWEAEEQARVRKALNEAVDISTQKLEARRARHDSEISSDDDNDEEDDMRSQSVMQDEDSGGSDSENGESNMSSSGSEGDEEDVPRLDATEDEHLSVEQLREKYAALPLLATEPDDDEMEGMEAIENKASVRGGDAILEDTFDDSDESIDMDDDMGSSDEDRDSDDEQDSVEDNDDDATEDSAALGLLGFLAPADLKLLKSSQNTSEPALSDTIDVQRELIAEGLKEKTLETGNVESSEHEKVRASVQSSTEPSATVKPVTEILAASPDRSSQPTPITVETRPSDIDSVSSVDPQQASGQITQSATPQPSNLLKTPIPFLLRGTLREYQHYGLDWLAGLYANNTNGILADEMGLGKTIQTIALLAHLACEHEVWGPHLVIVPTSVMLNWEMEFKKFLPGFKILTYYGSQDERKRKRQGWKRDEDKWNVIITSYQLVLQDQAVFKRRRWHYMILDEAHNIKNFQSQRWQAMLTFNTRARLLLTGTPLQNNLTELWSLLYFLMPSDGTEQGVGGFANLKEFQDWFKKPSEQILEHGREQMDDESRAIIAKLHKVLRPYLLRRLKADVEKQMPAKYEHVEFCRLSKRQRELYDGFLNREDTRGTLASGNYLSIINCLMQLRKVCNHPDLFVERAIMTSFPMEKSAVADYEIKDLLIRRQLLQEDPMSKVSLEFLNLVPTKHESLSSHVTSRVSMLSAQKILMDMREVQRTRAQSAFTALDPSTAKSNLIYLESASRWGRFEELQHCVYLNALRRQQRPTYGTRLLEILTLEVNERPLKPRPKRRDQMLLWLENSSPALRAMVPTMTSRSQALESTIQKFACVTPPVIARDLTSLVLTPKNASDLHMSVSSTSRDVFHEARMRLSIQFPDKRLLQYDCGKLQTLAKLLRKLQDGGHRALIFTQMTKVLDILEQFLNIHGYKYLRLDGSTKVEQRQILTDRFNNDNRILVFILSSRSGGLGINLTGADTVIFYDLDWNPAMDKQCQDRCHRIGQTRDVHIYRLVSEHTIEANILRKANQKRMLDDVVIQEGEFTTDYFNKASSREIIEHDSDLLDGDAQANAAMDRVLGGPVNGKDVTKVLAQAEDKEDVAAAAIAEREVVITDAADFEENAATASATPAVPGTPFEDVQTPGAEGTPVLMGIIEEEELNAWGRRVGSTDDYMLRFMSEQLKDTAVELPKDKNRSKRGKDHRNRSHRVR
ncbi:SNF2 family N-terminal domain-containing protein [Bisporella sp. PMI_857]|nr:SNF2 family N-terminal domain-containing protein [Bisporella sp. PMI_857]